MAVALQGFKMTKTESLNELEPAITVQFENSESSEVLTGEAERQENSGNYDVFLFL